MVQIILVYVLELAETKNEFWNLSAILQKIPKMLRKQNILLLDLNTYLDWDMPIPNNIILTSSLVWIILI